MHHIPKDDVRSVRYATSQEANEFALDTMNSSVDMTTGEIVSPFVRIWYDITNTRKPYVVDVALVLVAAH